MSLVIKGFPIDVPGRQGSSFRTSPRLALDRGDWRYRRRDEVVIGIVVHTRLGLPPRLKDGKGPNRGWDLDLAARWAKDDRKASAHIAVDADGSFACLADLGLVATYHAGHVNGVTVGIELYQEPDGTVYAETLEAAADVIDVATRELGIQRQYALETCICRRLANHLPGDPHTYIPNANRGRDFVGVYGHRNVTRNRGKGDPGDDIFGVLRARGYEGFRVDEGEDIAAWEQRQEDLGVCPRERDGVPEDVTRRLIMMARRGGPGLWVERPGDDTWNPPPAAG